MGHKATIFDPRKDNRPTGGVSAFKRIHQERIQIFEKCPNEFHSPELIDYMCLLWIMEYSC